MRLALASILALALAAPLAAQTDDRATALADWRRNKTNVLRFIDAMPESLLTYRPTPGVRTFAEQMEHFVVTNDDVAAQAVLGLAQAPAAGDTTRFLHNKAALRARVASSYDYVINAIERATPAQLSRRSSMYRQPEQTTMRWLALSLEHSVWTLGQVIPYMRLKGVTPPSYEMPF